MRAQTRRALALTRGVRLRIWAPVAVSSAHGPSRNRARGAQPRSAHHGAQRAGVAPSAPSARVQGCRPNDVVPRRATRRAGTHA